MYEHVQWTVGSVGAADTAEKASARIDTGTDDAFRVTRMDMTWEIRDSTLNDHADIYVVPPNMNGAELELIMEADPQAGWADQDGVNAVANQFIWYVGKLPAAVIDGRVDNVVGGPMIVIKPNRTWLQEEALTFALYSKSGLTTGTLLLGSIKYYGVWVRD